MFLEGAPRRLAGSGTGSHRSALQHARNTRLRLPWRWRADRDGEKKMTEHHHHHGGSQKHTPRENQKPQGRRLHKDWRLWVAVVLMLAAILIYVLTLDDARRTGHV